MHPAKNQKRNIYAVEELSFGAWNVHELLAVIGLFMTEKKKKRRRKRKEEEDELEERRRKMNKIANFMFVFLSFCMS